MTESEPAGRPSRLIFYQDQVVFDRVSGHFHRLNPSAALVLRALEGGMARDALPGLLEREYGIGHESAVRDAELFLNDLAVLGLHAGDRP